MAHINWIKEYSVGVKVIDDQHKYILVLLDELFEAIIALDTERKLEDIIARLAEHARIHFETEEKYFDEFEYEGSDDHKRRHQDLLARVGEFQKLFSEGQTNIASELVEFLEGWIISHMIEVDKKYIPCFEEHGLMEEEV